MNDRFRVAVDVGNSSIKFAAVIDGKSAEKGPMHETLLACSVRRVSLSSQDWPGTLADELNSWLPPAALARPIHWRIASVNSHASTQLDTWIASHRKLDSRRLISRSDIGMKVDVRSPERVGIDRLLGTQCAYLLAQRRAAICIDAGTTITVDLVDDQGMFRGGAIIPGLGLQLRSLHQATDKLPWLVPSENFQTMEVPARDTAAAMQTGVAYAALGAIERLVDAMRGSVDVSQVFVTGGDAPPLSPALRITHELVPDMPLRGLYFAELIDCQSEHDGAGVNA